MVLVNYSKLVLFMSTTVLAAPSVFLFFMPAALSVDYSNFFAFVYLLFLSDNFFFFLNGAQGLPNIGSFRTGVYLDFFVVAAELTEGSPLVGTLWGLLSIFFLCVAGQFLFNYFLQARFRFFFLKFYKFLKFNLFLNLPFLNIVDSLGFFFFFIFNLYFFEIHFFFFNLFALSSDSTVYQINFLMFSFSIIFFFKLFRVALNQGIFFFVSSNFNNFFFFTTGEAATKNVVSADRPRASLTDSVDYPLAHAVLFFRSAVYSFTFFLFFLSTFFIWVLRYCIQFIRLVVLFMIHTIFELAVVNSDFFLSGVSVFSFFFFKYLFIIFTIFWGFVYLLAYLNLMLTLQVFIFYFFSEVFQSNFLFDLSASVSNLLAKK